MRKKIALVGSSGGHLTHLLALESWWVNHERVWVTFKKPDAESQLSSERVVWCFHPTNRNAWNLFRNAVLAMKLLWRERPDVIVSSGAAVAVPFFYIGKLFGAKTVFIEVYDRISTPTLTGRLVSPVADRFFVQWEEQLAFYKRAELIGELL